MNSSDEGMPPPFSRHLEIGTNDLPLGRAAYLLWTVVPPCILFSGTFGNLMSIAVHRRLSSKRKYTVSLYLTALAAADLALLYSSLLVQWLNFMLQYDVTATSDLMCKTLIWLIYTTGASSAWLLVAVTLQRAVSVVWPHRVSSLITFRRSLVFIVCLLAFIMLVHAHLLFGWGVVSGNTLNDTFSPQCTPATQDYLNFFYRVWSWIDLLLFSLAPFTILLASNLLLLKTLVTSLREARQRLNVGGTQQVVAREKVTSSMTTTLMVLSFSFIVLTSPICAFLLMKPYVFDEVSIDYEKEAVQIFVYAIANFMWYSNSAINFYLYCLSGSKFRSELKVMLNDLRRTLEAWPIFKISVKLNRATQERKN